MPAKVTDAIIELTITVYDDETSGDLDEKYARQMADAFIFGREEEMGKEWKFTDTERLNYNRVKVHYVR